MNEQMLFFHQEDGLYIKHAQTHAPDPSHASFLSHNHELYEIYYFLRGEGESVVEGNIYTLEPGTLLITSKFQTHNIRLSESGVTYERFVIMFDELKIPPEAAPVIQALHQEKNCFLLERSDAVWFETCMASIIEAGQCGFSVSSTSEAVIRLLFLRLCRYLQKGSLGTAYKDETVRQIIRFINSHLHENWTLASMEKALFRDRSYLNRKFRSVMGSSIWEYVMKKRIFFARQELFRTESVKHAYEVSGFGDYSSFYRKYISFIGCSPQNDLKQHHSRQE